jgi:hypothetical protein
MVALHLIYLDSLISNQIVPEHINFRYLHGNTLEKLIKLTPSIILTIYTGDALVVEIAWCLFATIPAMPTYIYLESI